MSGATGSKRRLATADALTYWMSPKIPNDQFLLYAFDEVSTDVDAALREVHRRAQACSELKLRILDNRRWSYPVWALREVGPDQFVVHDPVDPTWSGCLAAVTALAEDQLDARALSWRLHVYPAIDGVPGARLQGTVAVLQICHALGDGVRASALAAYMFGRSVLTGYPRWGNGGRHDNDEAGNGSVRYGDGRDVRCVRWGRRCGVGGSGRHRG